MCVLTARSTAFAWFKVVTQSAFQEKFSYSMAVRGSLGREWLMGRQTKAFVVANEMNRGGVAVVVTAFFRELVSDLVRQCDRRPR